MSLRTRLGFTQEPIYLMDGSAFLFRGFYAFQNMTRSDGFPTNALYIVARLLLRLIREERPQYLTFILDGKGKSFRHERYELYKAQRTSTPEPLLQQIPPIRELLAALGIPVLVSEGCEADDYIASLAYKFKQTHPVIIVGADKDLKQCLDTQVVLWDPASKDERITTLQDFQKETGMEPSSWPDYQALIGDSSDNIPGVPKVGPKTALSLMPTFPTLESIFDHLAAVPPKIRTKLEGHRDLAMMCRELTKLRTNYCENIRLDEVTLTSPNMELAQKVMQEYELRSLLREVSSMERTGSFQKKYEMPKATTGTSQPVSTSKGEKPFATIDTPLLSLPIPEKKMKKDALVTDSVHIPPTTAQGSLFPEASAPVSYIEASTVADIPRLQHSLALLLVQTGLIIASENWERKYTGEAALLAEKLTDLSTHCITADLKSLWNSYPNFEQIPLARWFDISLAAYLLSPEERSYNFSHLAQRFESELDSPWSYVAAQGNFALDLANFLKKQMQAVGLEDVFSQLEMPLVPVLAHMERRGITIDKTVFSSFLREVQIKLDTLTESIYALAERTFNIRSSQQLGDVLFSVLNLPAAGKTKGGAASTSQEALEKLKGKHPIIDAILEFRVLEKLRSTYLEPLPKLADSSGRIHTTFNQMATATGRLSSSNPNLQNIPIRGKFGGRMRSCFIAQAKHKLVCADYSQIELRVLAHLSQDATLLEAFHHNEDIHSKTAALLYDTPLQDITPEQRRNAKTINFGLIYGMGAQKLARELNISMAEAKEFMSRYFAKLTKLKEFYDSIEKSAQEHGFVITMTGRRRLTPDITSANSQLKSQARRQAINTRIQGSAADIIKLAMIAVESDPELKRLKAKLLLQIHDELVLEVPEQAALEAAKRLKELMENVQPGGEKLSVPLVVDCGIGNNWAEAH